MQGKLGRQGDIPDFPLFLLGHGKDKNHSLCCLRHTRCDPCPPDSGQTRLLP